MTMYESAFGASRPWNSVDALRPIREYADVPQQEIEVCLTCPLCADACERCSGDRNPRKSVGRPKKEYDSALLLEMMRLKRCNAEMCAALGIGRSTLAVLKKQVKGETT